MRERVGETISGEEVLFTADTRYTDCTFEDCSYAFDGTAFNVSNCRFGDGMWDFRDAAGTTIDVLGAFWTSPGSEPLLESLFQRITGDIITARRIVALKPPV